MRSTPRPVDPLAATESWFLHHGLSYFVPEERAEARSALRPRRVVPLVLLVGLAAAAAGGALAWVAEQLAFAPATLVTIFAVSALWYALTALHARPIARWALQRTFGSLRTLLPMMSRALPLLLIFVTFLFINAEVWEVAAGLHGTELWLVVLLFGLLAGGFLLVRLPEEVDRTDDDVDDELLLRACHGTPMEAACLELVEDPRSEPASYAEVTGFERWNLVLVLAIIQAVQVALLSVTVFLFFMLFGSMVMEPEVVQGWTGGYPTVVPGLPNVSVELLQVSVFLAAFSNLYLTVATMTDEAYRAQFFGSVLDELERAVGVRAVYLALRDRPESR